MLVANGERKRQAPTPRTNDERQRRCCWPTPSATNNTAGIDICFGVDQLASGSDQICGLSKALLVLISHPTDSSHPCRRDLAHAYKS